MRLYQYIFVSLIFYIASFTLSIPTFAAINTDLQNTIKEYGIEYQKQAYVGNTISIDLSSLQGILEENFSNTPLEYEWNIYGQSPQKGILLNTRFETVGEKQIQLSIYTKDTEGRKLLHSSEISIFIYEKSIPLVVSSTISEKVLASFVQSGKELGVYVKILGIYGEESIPGGHVFQELNNYQISFPERSDYLMIWGEKEFLFSTMSQIYASNKNIDSFNFVLVTSYNTSILQSYISNSIAGKNFIDTGFIIDESIKFQVLKHPKYIKELEKEIQENSYNYTPLMQGDIKPYFFASRFVNMLSNTGVPNSDIYIILLLPLFLTLVGFAKHMIGLSSLGNIIPVFMALLFIKMGIIFIIALMMFLLVFNIVISKFFSKYTLLYTPKVSSITILNLLVFMGIYQGLAYFDIIYTPLDNILYLAIFFIIAEKMISIISSKEFREYKKSIFGTLIIALLCYMMYSLDGLRVFLMAYPEALLIFVPLNFFLGRFTGLRITEYLRFKEIIKSIEEE